MARGGPVAENRKSVTPRVPILIGITGKRDLKGQDELVRERLRQAFDILDQRLPNAPKVLLSGLAVGADSIAAELVLARRNWLIAAVLPMPLETYAHDFADVPASPCQAGARTDRQRLEQLLAHPKVRTRVLTPLRNPATGCRCGIEELENRPGAPNPLRLQHYEQLALWLAEAATLLIAVMPTAEQPGRPGGTARVVHYRLSGRPDAAAREVMRLSDEVCEALPLDMAGLGPVWLIDAPLADGVVPPATSSTVSPVFPLEVRLPQGETELPRRLSIATQVDRSLTVSRGFDRLASQLEQTNNTFDWAEAAPDAVAGIAAIHGAIGGIQRRRKNALIHSTYGLAVLFWLAVGTYSAVELSAGEARKIPLLGVYLAFAIAAVLLHWRIERKRLQRIAEDYRGVDEALRVQRAWWNAGLSGPQHRADRYFLVGAQYPLRPVRHAVRTIISWGELGASTPPNADWSQIQDPANPLAWLPGQIEYFTTRSAQRKRNVFRTHMLGWELFFCAQFLAAWLCFYPLLVMFGQEFLAATVWRFGGLLRGIGFLAVASAIWVARHFPLRYAEPTRPRTLGFALLLAILIGPGLHLLAGASAREPWAGLPLGAMLVVLFSAAAAAVRFVAEKLAWEAEAHRYGDARALFEHAASELAALDREPWPPEERLRRKQQIVLALGHEALEQTEYWLRTHRERPVEVAVG